MIGGVIWCLKQEGNREKCERKERKKSCVNAKPLKEGISALRKGLLTLVLEAHKEDDNFVR